MRRTTTLIGLVALAGCLAAEGKAPPPKRPDFSVPREARESANLARRGGCGTCGCGEGRAVLELSAVGSGGTAVIGSGGYALLKPGAVAFLGTGATAIVCSGGTAYLSDGATAVVGTGGTAVRQLPDPRNGCLPRGQ